MSTLQAVGNANGVSANILAAISLRESDAIETRVGDYGHGHGAFQIDDRYHPIEAATVANDFDLAANFAAGLISGAYQKYSLQVNPQIALAAAIRDYNASSTLTPTLLATGGSLDTKTTGRNYVSNVLAIAANCFQ